MSQPYNIARPNNGATEAIELAANSTINLGFDPAEASISRVESNLVFAFDEGGEVVFNNFFTMALEALPEFVLPDQSRVTSTDLFEQSDLEFPAAQSAPPSNGINSYADNCGELVSGLEMSDSLGTNYWSASFETSSVFAGLTVGTSSTLAASQTVPQPESPPEPQPMPPTEPQTPFDERFVVTRDNAPVTFGHVLHNDAKTGAEMNGASIIGIKDAQGIFYSLAEIAAMNNGLGLETEFGWIRVEDDMLIYEAKDGVHASSMEVVTYVVEDGNGSTYTQNVQIRFSDDANYFSSNEAVDTYYSQDTSDGQMANISLGAGDDRIIVEGNHAYNNNKTIHAGDGNNYIELNSGGTASVNSGSLSIGAGSGSDTIIMTGDGQSTWNSTVNINSGAGDDSIHISATDKSSIYGNSSMSIDAGEGQDEITVEVGQLANANSRRLSMPEPAMMPSKCLLNGPCPITAAA